jgi:hypothetical protein
VLFEQMAPADQLPDGIVPLVSTNGWPPLSWPCALPLCAELAPSVIW